MIQINELRIGNLIERNGIFAKIEIINNELDEVYFMGEDFYYSDFCCNIEPIQLTEEWLIKFGFVNGEKDNFWFTEYMDLRIIGSENDYNGIWVGNVEYVHQLQNLYFSLTGAELTVA